MDSFEFSNVKRIVFGRGTASRIGELAAGLGKRCLLVSNAGETGDGGTLDQVVQILEAAEVRTTTFRQRGEPTITTVESALAVARDEKCDVLVGLGGGSAIDAAKAVAGLLANGGGPLDYMEVIGRGQPLIRPAIPWIAIPTTAGTGAEVTRNAVLGDPQKRFKASLRSEHLLATLAVVDPELGTAVPRMITASSGMDALCQLIESYTSRRANRITDGLAAVGIPQAVRALPRVVADGQDLEAREAMALAALLSGITLANVGLGAVHGFAAPMGANYPIPHGTVCALLLPPVFQANARALRETSKDHPYLCRYEQLGRWLAEDAQLTGESAIEAGLEKLRGLVEELRIAPLREFGVKQEDFAELVLLAQRASSMKYNPIELSAETLTGILAAAW